MVMSYVKTAARSLFGGISAAQMLGKCNSQPTQVFRI